MSAKDSHLSSAKYGYDVVVATTQSSINAAMKLFLDTIQQPVVNVCFIADEKGNPVRIEFSEVQKACDPFSIPASANPETDPKIKKLLEMRFMAGFRARLGIPTNIRDPRKVPDLVELGSDTGAVAFNMLCAEFEIVELVPGGYGGMSWVHLSQSDGDPWIFQSRVDLRMSTLSPSHYEKLPPDVQRQIKNLNDEFSIRQLLFDFANAGLASPPTIQNVPAGSKLEMLLQQYFIGAYFNKIQSNGEPVLNVAIVRKHMPSSTLAITDLNFQVSPLVSADGARITAPTHEQGGIGTLAYLCETNNNIMPPAVPFTWNWVDAAQRRDFDGAIAINRGTFVRYLRAQLETYVSEHCYLPYIRLTQKGLVTHWEWSLKNGQTPVLKSPESGSLLLDFSYCGESSDQAGHNGAIGRCTLQSTFNLSVKVEQSKIVISQTIKVWLKARSLATEKSGNIVNKTIVDTILLSVSADGRLVVGKPETTSTDTPDKLHVDPFLNFWTALNSVTDGIKNYAISIASQPLTSIPVGAAQNFVFPGGRTFAFKDVAFSEHQDLVGHITYTTDQ